MPHIRAGSETHAPRPRARPSEKTCPHGRVVPLPLQFLLKPISVWLASRLDRLTLGESAPDTHWIGDWVGHTAGLDLMEK
jgi:hypothetical protein